MTEKIPVEQVILLHRDLIAAGPLLFRDKLEGAVEAPFSGMVDVEFYPTVTQKAVKLVDSISRAQAFLDGNKRLAWVTMTTFVQVNGLVVCDVPTSDAADWVLNLEGDTAGLRAGAVWLNDRLESLT